MHEAVRVVRRSIPLELQLTSDGGGRFPPNSYDLSYQYLEFEVEFWPSRFCVSPSGLPVSLRDGGGPERPFVPMCWCRLSESSIVISQGDAVF